MSQENVEIVRAGIEAINRYDFDAAFAAFHPDCEVDMSRAIGPDRGIHTIDWFRATARAYRDHWESSQWEVGEYIEAGENVVTPVTNRLRGRDGVEVNARTTWVWTFRDGVVRRATLYQEREQALEAAGLSE